MKALTTGEHKEEEHVTPNEEKSPSVFKKILHLPYPSILPLM